MAKVPHLVSLLKLSLSFLLLTGLAINGATTSDDINCLWTLKGSISDPNGYLSSWDFTDAAQGAFCVFHGISCWSDGENKVMSLQLSNMGLKGQFPSGLQLCASLTGLDLSGNSFTGSIPENINQMVPFVTSIDLSFNSFTGEIPASLSFCQYLNTINLEHNSLTRQIPEQLTNLSRLTTFNVANNLLSGPIPAFKNQFTADSYANNLALCGTPLNITCRTPSKKKPYSIGVVIASALGAVTGVWIGVFLSSVLDFSDPATPRYYCYLLRKFALYFRIYRTRDY